MDEVEEDGLENIIRGVSSGLTHMAGIKGSSAADR